MDLSAPLLESWDRQCRILANVAGQIDETTRSVRPSPDGWTLDRHLAHIHEVRYSWLLQVSPERARTLDDGFESDGETPLADLDRIRELLAQSGKGVRESLLEAFSGEPKRAGPYDHPVFFLQHMVWHEGWHVGLIFLGLRLAGAEPSEDWEEENVWGVWRRSE